MKQLLQRWFVSPHAVGRAALVAYLVGVLGPLVALAYVLYAAPDVTLGPAVPARGVLLCGAGLLAAGCFAVLRRAIRQSLTRLDAHTRRLEALLDASQAVAEAPYGAEVGRNAAEFALTLARASAAYVLVGPEKDGDPFAVEGRAGAEAAQLYPACTEALEPVLDLAASGTRVALAGRELAAAAQASGLAAVAAVPLAGRGGVDGMILALRGEGQLGFDEAQLRSLSTLAALVSVARHNADLRDSQRNFFAHVTELLMNALDAYMDLQQGHSRRVAHYCGLVGRELGLDESKLERLHFAGLLHDIGMLKIPNTRIAGNAAYKQHPQLGYRMLKPIRLWRDLAPLVLHHHEWFNGGGYPEGLSGEAIPLESRIIGVAEAFDSMTSCKSYREPLSVERALEEIREGAGTQFDPTVARLFVELARRGVLLEGREG